MKSIVKKLVKDEKGAALALALILLLIGGLISAALLGHMGSGILAGTVHERRTDELYAADAGVEDAIWKIQHEKTPVCPASPEPWCYPLPSDPPIIVNGRSLQICIEYLPDEGTYKITSIATTDGDGSGGVASIDSATAVESYVSFSYMDFSALLDHAIVSYDTITIQPGNEVYGDVWLPDEEDLTITPPSGGIDEVIFGDVYDEDNFELTWPTVGQLSVYYLDDVDPSNPYPYNSIDITYTKNIGPCYIEGDFVVDNTGDPDTLVLDGTVYVAGDLEFQQSGTSHNYTVDLNGHTIFAEGSIDFPSNVVGISGPGCIIAIGDINFQPSVAGNDFVLVMSITGQTYFHPSGDFTGCVAGNMEVQLQPGCTITWIPPEGKGLDFPGAEGGEEPPSIDVMKIESWEIIQQ